MMVVLAGIAGCVSSSQETGPQGSGTGPRMVPGVQGPWGTPVPMIAPYTSNPPKGAALAQAMMRNAVPSAMVQGGMTTPGGIAPPGQMAMGGGMPYQGAMPVPGMQPGAMPSVGVVQAGASEMAGGESGVVRAGGITPPGMAAQGPMPQGPNGIQQVTGWGPHAVPNAVAAVGAITGPGGPRFPTRRTEVRFVGPAGMKISWPGPGPNNSIEAPGRYNFIQGAMYRLKLSDLTGRPGVDLYPTLEVLPANLRTDAYIAHSAVPLYFTDEDFEQVLNGNFLVKVIYLPNPQYADVAMTGGPEEVVSTRLEPGVDPIAEACKRGSILLIVRMGNIDLEAPNTPAMDAPGPLGAAGPLPGAPMMAGAPMMGGMPGGPMMGGMPQPGMAMNGPPMLPPPPGMPMPVAPFQAAEQMLPNPGVLPAANTVPATPVSKKPGGLGGILPVKYTEPTRGKTPAQLAGQ